jgi:3-oxoacyl-[acyl-carrier protein] reductase
MKFDEIQIGQKAEFDVTITPLMVDQFVNLIGDINSIHFGKDSIVHGMLVASFMSTFIGVCLPGDGAIWVSSNIRFISPVKVNDDLKVIGRVAGKNHNNNQVELFVDIIDRLTANHFISATCLVKVPD